jgi:hypothetical protein
MHAADGCGGTLLADQQELGKHSGAIIAALGGSDVRAAS